MESQPESEEGELAGQLRRLVQAGEAAGRAVLPSTDQALLQSIVDAAARIFGAAAASIALVDETQGMLEFRVAYGAGNQDVVGRRVPLDQGLAGYVAMTGQPMAISNVQQDARFNRDFAQSTGYVPRSILATPLISEERVIGVMEVLDKIDAPSFGIQDMELLSLFAQQAAIAIHQSQQFERIGEALVRGLKDLVRDKNQAEANGLAAALEGGPVEEGRSEDLLALAELFQDISALGEADRRACLKILAVFREYGRSKTRYF